MTDTKLPMFKRWAAKLVERKRKVMAALFIAACLAVAHEALRRYFAAPLACDQPCPEGVGCDPLSLSVEVKPTRIKAGAPNALWYRAELKNRSCRRLSVLNAQAFVVRISAIPATRFGRLPATVSVVTPPVWRSDAELLGC